MLSYKEFRKEGYDFFVGVPCSQLNDFIKELILDEKMQYVPVTKEDVAMGLAVGAYMSGKKPLVFLQNSGLGHLVNVIASLLKPYGVSIHLLISVRTKPFQHFFMHKITESLLKLLKYDDYTLVRGKE